MADSKHTPGPWVAAAKTAGNGAEWEIKAGDFFVCAFGFTGEQCPEAQANARLIATAPELLDALKEEAEWLEEMARYIGRTFPGALGTVDQMNRRALKLRAAIAEAEGR